MKLILASASPQKKSLLNKLGLSFVTVPAEIDEKPKKDEKPETFARRSALKKAKKISKKEKGAHVIAHDMVIDFNEKIIGEPKDEEDAKKILKSFSGKEHDVVGVVVLVKDGEELYQGVQRTKVKFKKLKASEINEYVKTGEPLDKAGAYAIQGDAGMFIESIEGSYFNIVGLPLLPLIRELAKIGVEAADDVKQTVEMQEKSIKESFPR